jgi:hypothetical protein
LRNRDHTDIDLILSNRRNTRRNRPHDLFLQAHTLDKLIYRIDQHDALVLPLAPPRLNPAISPA